MSTVTPARVVTDQRVQAAPDIDRRMALWIVLERRAGEQAAAAGHLEAFLRLFAETPYVRPLIREHEACAAVVTAFLESAVVKHTKLTPTNRTKTIS